MSNSEVIPPLTGWPGQSPVLHYYVCDVFTSVPLQGNQLAVYVDGRTLGTEDMQLIAKEMNIAETVFLLPAGNGGDVAMRIFTPAQELPFAGHPVLGTAFVVGSALEADRVVLETGAGPVPVVLDRADGQIVFGRMNQPIPTWKAFDRSDELLHAVGAEKSGLPIEVYQNGPAHAYVRLATEEAVAQLSPDMTRLGRLGVAANCFAGEGTAWKTRMFYPAGGVAEDPATGSAAGPLAVYLARHGQIDFGEEIVIRQGEEIGRPSKLYAAVYGTADGIERIEVGGGAVIVGEGRYRVSTG
jgi:trans-2,3-dihydro-3-hydroxyanthranilate isomerase